MKYIIFGGTNEIIASVISLLPDSSDIILLGRSPEKFIDLFGKNSTIQFIELDLSSIGSFNQFMNANERIFNKSTVIYSASITHIEFCDDVDSYDIINSVNVNYAVPYLLLSFLTKQSCQPEKFIYFSSISAFVPRVKNILYSTQKRSFDTTIDTLKSKIPFTVMSIRIGFVSTMYAKNHIPFAFLSISPKSAARMILKFMNKNKSGIFVAPFAWRLLSLPFVRYLLK